MNFSEIPHTLSKEEILESEEPTKEELREAGLLPERGKILEASFKTPEGQTEKIRLDIEEAIAEYESLYREAGISVETAFAEQIREIWERNHDSIKETVETFGFDQVLVIPEDLPEAEELNQKMIERMEEDVEVDDGAGGKKVERQKVNKTNQATSMFEFKDLKEGTRIVLTHTGQEVSENLITAQTMGKSILELTKLSDDEIKEKIQKREKLPMQIEVDDQAYSAEGLTLSEYIILQTIHFRETGKHLEEKKWTWLPGSVVREGSKKAGRVAYSLWLPGERGLDVGSNSPSVSRSDGGCRLSRSFS